MEAVVLVGGLGTRLQSVVSDRPKVLARVADKPFLDFLFEYLAHHGMTRIVLSVGYKKEQIQDWYGNHFRNVTLDYSEEEEPLGTGGAIQKSLLFCESENIFVLNGDSLFFVPLGRMRSFHEQRGATITLAVRKVPEGNRYGSVTFDRDGRIQSFSEKKISGPVYINGGIYCVHREKMGKVCEKLFPPFSIEKDVFPKMVQGGDDIRAFPVEAFFIDIGVPESLSTAQTKLPAQFPIKDGYGVI